MSQCCNKFIFDDTPDTFQMWQGLRGPYFTPHVAENGDLSWSNNGQLTNPETVNIKGPPGPGGAPGGTTGQLLAKSSDEDYDTEWIDPPDLDAGHVEYDPAEAYDDGSVGKELTTINSALSSLSAVTEIIDTASGAIASFPDGSGLPMRSLVATIEPQQDLHGQDAPYPAGGGKNKCSVDSFSLEKPEERAKRIAIDAIPAGTYTISWVSNTTATTTMQIQDANNTSMVGNITITNSGSVTKTFTSDAAQIYAFISTSAEDGSTATISNLQIELGSTATTYAPYANECPITGWDGLSGKRCGKNLLDDSIKSSASGGFVFFNTAGDRYHKTTTLQAGTYTFSVTYSQAFETTKAHLNVYDVETDTRLAFAYNNTKVSFTLAKITDISLVVQNSGLTTSDILTAQLEVGSTASTFEPYTSLPITCTWQTEAGTVYGGTVDVVSGVLTVDMGIKTELWKNFTSEAVVDTNLIRRQANISSAKGDTENAQKTISNIAPFVRTIADKSVHVSMASSGNYLYAILPPTTDPDLEITFCYPLATPQTYQLSPQQIETLLGNNTVFVDCGSVSVTYQASIKGYIDKVLAS